MKPVPAWIAWSTSIDKRVAIVTGASRGIGRAIARRLGDDGHHVICVARSVGPLEEVVSEIKAAGGDGEDIACDIGDSEQFAGLVESIFDRYDRLDILVNNAGVTRDGLVLRMDDEDFDHVVNVNLRSAFVSCRAAARPMMRGRYGRIINIGSVSGLMGNAGQVNYAASKAGLVGLTKSIAKELGPKGITANVIAPGFIQTQMTEGLIETIQKEIAPKIPLRRLGEPEEVASAASWLSSEEAGYVTGQVLVVDGGLAM